MENVANSTRKAAAKRKSADLELVAVKAAIKKTKTQSTKPNARGRQVTSTSHSTTVIVANVNGRDAKHVLNSVSPASCSAFLPDEQQQIRTTLLAWYDANHRVLPWRRNFHSKRLSSDDSQQPAPLDLDPQRFAYMVWVSEVMCQQTQVATVCPYFNKWLQRWPSAEALAAATQEEVNTMWAGLGYYRRARYLLDGAQYICQKLSGKFPETSKELLQIPGVGPYTAAAVSSIAFGQPSAAVDGNVIRVVSRLRALQGDPRQLSAVHASLAGQILDPSRPGDFNQAMMELGATVCKPSNPDCSACPVAHSCHAQQQWRAYLDNGGDPDIEDAPTVTRYPTKVAKAAKKEQEVAVCVVEVQQRNTAAGPAKRARKGSAAQPAEAVPASAHYLLCKRPEGGLLAGLWEFPAVPISEDNSSEARQQLVSSYLADTCRLSLDGDAAASASVSIVSREELGSLPHIFSHIRWQLHVEKLVVEADLAELRQALKAVSSPEMKLVEGAEMVGQGLTSSVHKIFKLATSAPAGASTAAKGKKAAQGAASITKFFKATAKPGV